MQKLNVGELDPEQLKEDILNLTKIKDNLKESTVDDLIKKMREFFTKESEPKNFSQNKMGAARFVLNFSEAIKISTTKIPKGTKLCRFVSIDANIDTITKDYFGIRNDEGVEKDTYYGRINYPNHPVLYLGLDRENTLKEANLDPSKKSYLGIYEVEEDLELQAILIKKNPVTEEDIKATPNLDNDEAITEALKNIFNMKDIKNNNEYYKATVACVYAYYPLIFNNGKQVADGWLYNSAIKDKYCNLALVKEGANKIKLVEAKEVDSSGKTIGKIESPDFV